MARVAGADGCRAGWICLIRNTPAEAVDPRIVASAADLEAFALDLDVLAIDIPIGLPDRGQRRCDELARQLLGSPRASSVFPPPVRPALHATTREEASEITSRIDGRRVSAQAWGIYPKIRDIDNMLRKSPELQRIVCEVHPEVCFWAWNGSEPIVDGKKTLNGMNARLTLVDSRYGPSAYREIRSAVRNNDVGDDDLFDAFAALWTAERIALGQATSLPPEPPLDSVGLRMAVFY